MFIEKDLPTLCFSYLEIENLDNLKLFLELNSLPNIEVIFSHECTSMTTYFFSTSCEHATLLIYV